LPQPFRGNSDCLCYKSLLRAVGITKLAQPPDVKLLNLLFSP
jgi:hypothetical protein